MTILRRIKSQLNHIQTITKSKSSQTKHSFNDFRLVKYFKTNEYRPSWDQGHDFL